MTRQHFDALPQGVTKWQLTICLSVICAAYLSLAYLDEQESKRAECVHKHQNYSDSLDQCLKELPHHGKAKTN